VLWQPRGAPLILENIPAVKAAGWNNLYSAYGINDAGWIVGVGAKGGSSVRAYLLMP